MTGSTTPPSNIDLLIVDDDADLRELLRYYFSNLNYRVETAATGTEAIALSARLLPRLILLDINLPGTRGYDVYRAVRAMPGNENISIIFLTMLNTRDERLAGLTLGADDYIGKPFDVQELRLRVENRLRRSH
jgi:two-component system phosphate regulon response regulator PhoB